MLTIEQIPLWPRLLAAARQLDPDLAAQLDRLRVAGATLTMDGPALRLARGSAADLDWQRVRTHPRIGEVIRTAKSAPHPWRDALNRAYQAVHDRADRGSNCLEEAIRADDRENAPRYARVLCNVHRQALMLLTAITLGGGDEAARLNAQLVLDHEDDLRRLRAGMARAGIHYDDSPQWYPIDTPDGRVWVVEATGTIPRAAQPGDLIVTAEILGEALAPLTWDADWKEAG